MLASEKPRILVVTRGDYITRTVLRSLFRSDAFDLLVVIVKGDHRGRTGWHALRELCQKSERHYCVYELTQQAFFSMASRIRRRSGLTVRSLARRMHIPVLKTRDVNDDRVLSTAQRFNPHVLLSVKCPQLIGERLRNVPRCGAVNIHASLLPGYAGRAPHFWAMANGETFSGTTAHYMTGRFDAGPILAQRTVEISARDSAFWLLRKLAMAGDGIVQESIDLALRGVPGVPQHGRRVYCSHPTREAYRRFCEHGRRLFRFRELLAATRRSSET
jgi:methionyl-tRNA formyltransferase